ncbi:MAG: ROK family protein [Streptococcus sp.]
MEQPQLENRTAIKKDIESALGIPFFIDNDANVALGERWKGAGENQPDVVFMTRNWCWWRYRCGRKTLARCWCSW